MTQALFAPQSYPNQPIVISREIFAALSPLDQVAAKALERVGKVRIVSVPESKMPGGHP